MLWAYLALVACLAGCTYAIAVTALTAPHVRVDSGGGFAAVDVPAGSSAWLAPFDALIFPVLAAFWLSFVAAQVLSWRRSSGERRQQLKWLLTGAAVFAASQVICQPLLNFVPDLSGQVKLVLNVLLALGAAALPVCIGMGILKYRLYEIDRIISRTLAYAIVTGLLVGVYAGLVLLATQVFRFHPPVAVAASTLAAAALFNPLRRRVQQGVDRRFNRARYDADEDGGRVRGPGEGRRGPGLGAVRTGRCRAPGPGTRPRLGVDQPGRTEVSTLPAKTRHHPEL